MNPSWLSKYYLVILYFYYFSQCIAVSRYSCGCVEWFVLWLWSHQHAFSLHRCLIPQIDEFLDDQLVECLMFIVNIGFTNTTALWAFTFNFYTNYFSFNCSDGKNLEEMEAQLKSLREETHKLTLKLLRQGSINYTIAYCYIYHRTHSPHHLFAHPSLRKVWYVLSTINLLNLLSFYVLVKDLEMKEFMINYMLLLLTLRMVLALPTPVPTPAPTPAPEPEPLPGHFNSPTYAITHLAFHKCLVQ